MSLSIFPYAARFIRELSIPLGLKTTSSGAFVYQGVSPYAIDLKDTIYPCRGTEIMYPVSRSILYAPSTVFSEIPSCCASARRGGSFTPQRSLPSIISSEIASYNCIYNAFPRFLSNSVYILIIHLVFIISPYDCCRNKKISGTKKNISCGAIIYLWDYV